MTPSPTPAPHDDVASTQSYQPEFRPSWAKLIGCAFGGSVLAIVYVASLAPSYRAEAVIILPGAGTSQVSSVAQQLGISIPREGSSIQMFKAILESNSALDFVAQGIGRPAKQVKDVLSLEDDIRANTISLVASDRDKDVALKLLNLRIDALRKINYRVILPSKNSELSNLNQEIARTKGMLKKAENELLAFNREASTSPTVVSGTSVVVLPASYKEDAQQLRLDLSKARREREFLRGKVLDNAKASGTLPTISPVDDKWRTTLSNLDYELEIARQRYLDSSPEVRQILGRKQAAEQSLRRDVQKYVLSAKKGLMDPTDLVKAEAAVVGAEAELSATERLAARAPYDAMRFQQLSRNVAMLTKQLEQLTQLQRQSEMEQSADPNRWEILDAPHVDPNPSNKRYVRFGGLGLLLGAIVGAFLAFKKKN